jgi:hypothetical protein
MAAARSAASATAQEAVPVSINPLTPEQDVAREYVWRAVPITKGADRIHDDMQRLWEDEKFEYASTSLASWGQRGNPNTGFGVVDSGHVHLFRRKRDSLLDRENNVEKLKLQVHAFELKIKCDRLQIEMANIAKERADALSVLAASGFQLSDE